MRITLLLAAATAIAASVLTSSPADACGGTFCARTPPNQPPMPVDQSGENVLFVARDGKVEAHVQIQYQGNPERFAWVVPMPKEPKISAGSQVLFDRLLQGTVPTFQVQNTFAGNCGSSSSISSDSSGCGMSAESSEDSASFAPSAAARGKEAADADPKAPQILGRASVGSYETVTLGGSDAGKLIDWLNENDYLIPDKTSEFIQGYLEQNYVFVAVKLTAGAQTNEIHPLVFTYEGTEPCVPLKLTAIAATQNMAVRTFFLGSQRFAPKNYKHVVVNDVLFDWLAASNGINAFGAPTQQTGRQVNYLEVVTRAIDTDLTGGRAFITEYAGSSSAVNASGIYNAQWQSKKFETLSSQSETLQELKNQGLLDCSSSSSCTSSSPLLFPLLEQTMNLPKGVSPGAYYSCPSCYKEVEPEVWPAEFFASELNERIIGPARHAEDLLRDNPFLTRLFTTISPAEMTADPEFVPTSSPVVARARTASQQRQCNGDQVMQIGGRDVFLGASTGAWVTFPDTMPAATRVEEFDAGGNPVLLRDNTATIDAELAAFNKARNWPPQTQFSVASSSDCSLAQIRVRGRTTSLAFIAMTAVALIARRRRGERLHPRRPAGRRRRGGPRRPAARRRRAAPQRLGHPGQPRRPARLRGRPPDRAGPLHAARAPPDRALERHRRGRRAARSAGPLAPDQGGLRHPRPLLELRPAPGGSGGRSDQAAGQGPLGR